MTLQTEQEKKSRPEKEHLCHFDIAGFTYHDGPEAFEQLKIGTTLQLKIDPDNKFDARAVAIYFNEFKLGFIPRNENRIIFKLLKVKFTGLETRIQRIDPCAHPENQVGVIVHLKSTI